VGEAERFVFHACFVVVVCRVPAGRSAVGSRHQVVVSEVSGGRGAGGGFVRKDMWRAYFYLSPFDTYLGNKRDIISGCYIQFSGIDVNNH
jgi:hypothetical protein